MRPQAIERLRLILLHETCVADHVSGEDGSEAALQAASPFIGRLADWHAIIHVAPKSRSEFRF